MILRGSGKWIGAVVVLLSLGSVFFFGERPLPASSAEPSVLTLALPGPFNGCTVLDSAISESSSAILDLVRPSAFQSNAAGGLDGAGGPIATAELTSLTPETVVYTLAAGLHWSSGLAFNGGDLVAWWRHARQLTSVQGDGYRSIKSLVVSKNGLAVTATFSSSFPAWNLLFRDVEARGAKYGCAFTALLKRPSLGAYRVVSATARRVVLAKDPNWTTYPQRFDRINITNSSLLPRSRLSPFASYQTTVNRAQQQALSAHPAARSRIGVASGVEEIRYAPGRPVTKNIAIRQALSWSLNRQQMISALWGSVTFLPTPAASALYSQGQTDYPGTAGSVPSGTTTTVVNTPTTTSPSGEAALADCPSCAITTLRKLGYRRSSDGWIDRRGNLLALRVIVGPSKLDQSVATLVCRQWKQAGIATFRVEARSDRSAAQLVAQNLDDVAIIFRSTISTPWLMARSWSGAAYADSYSSGFRSPKLGRLFSEATSNFNPTDASTTWLAMDQTILQTFLSRPLFTPPSLIEWSGPVGIVNPSTSVSGFVDQIPSWLFTGVPSVTAPG